MAIRPIFMTNVKLPFYKIWNAEFVYNAGFAPCQKKKNITAIHNKFNEYFPDLKVLEISSKSMQPEGILLSAFTLTKFVPSLGISVPVENIYQAGKVFSNGKKYDDLLKVSPKEAKKDERLKISGNVIGYKFEDIFISSDTKHDFYNWIYISALLENLNIAEMLLNYDAFTDIEFNPNKSINCQARAAAIFVSAVKQKLLNVSKEFSFKEYCKLMCC